MYVLPDPTKARANQRMNPSQLHATDRHPYTTRESLSGPTPVPLGRACLAVGQHRCVVSSNARIHQRRTCRLVDVRLRDALFKPPVTAATLRSPCMGMCVTSGLCAHARARAGDSPEWPSGRTRCRTGRTVVPERAACLLLRDIDDSRRLPRAAATASSAPTRAPTRRPPVVQGAHASNPSQNKMPRRRMPLYRMRSRPALHLLQVSRPCPLRTPRLQTSLCSRWYP